MNFRRLSQACLLVIMLICFKPLDVFATTYPISVTTSSNPNFSGLGDPVNATIYSSTNFQGQTGEGLFDGEIVNEWDTNKVYYWFGAYSKQPYGDQMLEIEFPEAVNIWRTGTSSWAGDYHYLQIFAWDGNDYTDDVTYLHAVQTSSLVNGRWEPFVVNLPAGKYKIGMDSTLGYKQRIDSEWYIESVATSEILADAQAAKTAVETAENTLDIDDYNEARSKVDALYTPVQPGVGTIPLSTVSEQTFTIDGTWHTINESVLSAANKTYLNDYINPLIQSGTKKFYIEDGYYKLSYQITINQPDVEIVGESTEGVFIDNYDAYSYGVVVSANGAVISTLTIDCKDDPNITGDKDGYATFLQNDCSNITLQKCVLVGPDIREAVKYNGKTISSLDDVENRNLDNGNIFLNCTVNSSFYGEGVSFSQQKNGVCKGNTINGTRLSFYLCADSFLESNTVNDSSSQGIFITVPAFNNVIANNTINSSEYAGIKVAKDYLHGASNNDRGDNIKIFNNTINQTNYFGIEINQLKNALVYNNSISDTDIIGIYLLRVEFGLIKDNHIVNPIYDAYNDSLQGWSSSLIGGIFADFHIQNTIIEDNLIENDLTYDSQKYSPKGIKIQNGNENYANSVEDNIMYVNFDNENRLQLNGTEYLVSEKKDLDERLDLIAP